MRTSTFIFIITIIFGCGERTTEEEINAFEQELGPQLSLELSNVVKHFESELNDRYSTSSTEQAYHEHLKFILAFDGLTNGQWLPCQFRKDSIFRIYSEELADEIWIKPDSVWIQDSRIYTPYWDNSEPIGRKIQDWVTNYDSLIFTESNTEDFNYKGKFLKAVQTISATNELANWYYDLKSNAGTISPHISAELLLENEKRNKLSLDDYLVKRIILVETYTETCSNKL